MNFFDLGIRNLVLSAILFALAVLSLKSKSWRSNFRVPSKIFEAVFAPSLSLLLSCIQWRTLLSDRFLNSASTNGDIVAYANVGLHIINNGFSDTGNTNAADFGLLAKTDVFGGYVLIGINRILIDRPINQILLPVLTVATMLLAHSIYRLVRSTLHVSNGLAGFLCVLPQTTFMFSYLMGNYFLAQIIGMAIFVGMFSMIQSLQLDSVATRNVPLTFVITFALLCAGLLLSYPHMTFVAIPLLVCFALLTQKLRNWVKIGLFVLCSTILGFVLVITRSTFAFSRFLSLAADLKSGWPLPGILPIQLLGFQSNEYSGASNLVWFWTCALFLLVGFSLVRLRKESIHVFPILMSLFLVFGTYLYVYLSSGVSYRQWKWITFFSPIAIVAMLAGPLLLLKITTVRKDIFRHGATFICLVLCTNNVLLSDNYLTKISQLQVKPNREMVELGPRLKSLSIDEVNVHLGPYLESMWPALFMSPSQINILDPSYYTVGEPKPVPTVVATGAKIFSQVNYRFITPNYILVEYPKGPVSTQVEGLESKLYCPSNVINTKVGENASVRLKISNIGSTTWLGSGSFRGAVNIGARIIHKDGKKTELARQQILDFPNYVLPKIDFESVVNFKLSEPGEFLIEISPVAEQVGWFADLKFENSCNVRIRVN